MGTDREARLVFGEDAHTYDRARPSYPSAAIDRIIQLAELHSGDHIAEVGAGTGIATALLSDRGFLVTAVEPDPEMAAVLAGRKLAAATVVVAPFEDWEPPQRFRTVVSAQAWHWLDQAAAPRRAARALEPGGWLALLWNRPAERDAEIDAIYERLVPSIAATTVVSNPAQRGAEIRATDGITRSGRYSTVIGEEYPWEQAYTTSEWLELISTHSDHRLLEPGVRQRLFDEVGQVIDGRGGVHRFRYVTRLVAARREQRPTDGSS